jgi:hypothetical protein
MNDTLIGLFSIAATILLGLIGIAIAIYYGLQAFRKEITDDLSGINEKTTVIQENVKNIWDIIKRSTLVGAAGTVTRVLKNVGTLKITAELHTDKTTYYLLSDKPIFDGKRITQLSKRTNLEATEKDMFGVAPVFVGSPIPTRLVLELPCIEPNICTKYMSIFLQWLDKEYFESLPKIEDFEEPIKP